MKCGLCPRLCGADRDAGQTGVCGADNRIRIARIAPHYWEEPCISGKNGSGAIFFSGCQLRCVFCQNAAISRRTVGKTYSCEQLADDMISLEQTGVHNINLVTPTHYVPQIIAALDIARPRVPVVYNTSGYELADTLRMLGGRVSVFLPDYKYHSQQLAKRYSNAEDYPQVAISAIAEMVKIAGAPQFDKDGMIKRGVIVRHLVLPGCADDSMRALRELHTRFGSDIMISIMNQYTPMPGAPAELSRSVTDDEYELVLDYADHLGITFGYRQEGGTVGESFIPDFDV